ncbi:MAG TPA: hypothetical protein VGC36_10005 [Rhizomicrobium sp.]
MSLVGPLVKPNRLETRFDRASFHRAVFRHPVISFVAVLLAAAAAAMAMHSLALPL